jgi:drug/metabolite transporter (DMT)-like permease
MSYLILIVSVLAYATGIVAQSHAARQTEQRSGVDPGLLVRLASQKVYLLGFGAQVVGFGLAFLARADLPLFLVQAASTSAVGVATLIGVLVLGWRPRPAELGILAVLAVGLIMLVTAAEPSVARELPTSAALMLVGALVLVALAAVPVGKLSGNAGAVAHGVLAGVAFAVLAIASRPLADGPLLQLPLQPLFYLVIVSALVGQTLLAAALQRGSAPAAAASMDAVTAVVSSVVGLTVLGDRIVAGQGAWVAVGLLLVVASVIGFGLFSSAPTAAPAATATAGTTAPLPADEPPVDPPAGERAAEPRRFGRRQRAGGTRGR